MPQPQQIPPLAWVRVFCEAGKQGSFKAAAAALNLSPSTVSHEIRKLEAWVETPLFDRSKRSITLTAEGATLFDAVRPMFDQLEEAFAKFRPTPDEPIRIGMFPFMASEFVVPLVDSISSQLAGQPISITSNNHLEALNDRDGQLRVDAVVRYSKEAPPGYESIPLTNISLALVVGIGSASGSAPDVVRRVRLDSEFDAWQRFEAAGFELPARGEPSLVVDNYLSAMRAVEQGMGIGIAVLPLCKPWIKQGRIRLWSNDLLEIPERYWLVWRKPSPKADALMSIGKMLATEFTR